MEEESTTQQLKLPAVISTILIVLIAGAFLSAKNRTGTVVLPGGITYLGPTPTKNEIKWNVQNGQTFPFSFSYPSTFSLGVFPNDPYDSVTAFITGTDSVSNVFFRVENLTKLNKSGYKGNVEKYANDWWKDYTWKGSASVTPFTNKAGLIGYRAKYLNDSNMTPYDHVFFEVPNEPNLVIWMSGRLFDQDTFNRLVDSVSWSKNP